MVEEAIGEDGVPVATQVISAFCANTTKQKTEKKVREKKEQI